MKRYEKYGRKVSWIVKWYGKCGRKVSSTDIRYGQYGRKASTILGTFLPSLFSNGMVVSERKMKG